MSSSRDTSARVMGRIPPGQPPQAMKGASGFSRVSAEVPPGGEPAPALFTPIGDMVAFQILQTSNKTEGGVILPETAKDSSWTTPVCLVIAVGPEVKQVKPGDHILVLNEVPLMKIWHGGFVYLQCQETGICGILNPDPPTVAPEKK